MSSLGRFVVDRILRPVGRAVLAFGSLWVHMPATELVAGDEGRPPEVEEPKAVPPPAAGGFGPPPWHPERLRPDIPLSREERALQRQLRGLDGFRLGGQP